MFGFKKKSKPKPSTNKRASKQPKRGADANLRQATIMGGGAVTVRQRPSLLLMKFPFRAAEATLELGLAKLEGQRRSAEQWLKGLGAVRVEFGEPHFADQAEMDPHARARALAAKALKKRPAKGSAGVRAPGVRVVLTAVWDIASMSAEETLKFLDRLRFEAAEDTGAAETAEESPPWTSPEEQLRQMASQLAQPPEVDDGPQFLFVAQLGEEQLAKASVDAFAEAQRNAERLARAAGMRLAGLPSLHFRGSTVADGRHDKMMERQRCAALLAGSSYDLRENEIVSDDPRSAEFTVSVNVTYALEEVSQNGDAIQKDANSPH